MNMGSTTRDSGTLISVTAVWGTGLRLSSYEGHAHCAFLHLKDMLTVPQSSRQEKKTQQTTSYFVFSFHSLAVTQIIYVIYLSL